MAPSLSLPYSYIIAALGFFLVLNLLLPFNADAFLGASRAPHLLALVHITSLGWVTMLIMGATFQLVPVALQVPIASEEMGRQQFVLYLLGVIVMAVSLWTWWPLGIGFAGMLLLSAVILYLINMAITLARVARWDFIAWHLAWSFGYLGLIALAGMTMAVNHVYPFFDRQTLDLLRAHAAAAILGWVGMMIMGVAYKLIPMFTLGEDLLRPRLAWIELWLANSGVLGLAMASLGWGDGWLGPLAGLILLAGVGLFAYQIFYLYRRRRRRVFDINFPFTLASVAYLLGIVLAGGLGLTGMLPGGERLWIALGYLAFLGWITLIIMGQLYKINTFLVWLTKYSSRVGKEPVPCLEELYSRPLGMGSYYAYNAGVLSSAAGIYLGQPLLLTIALAIAAAASLGFLWNMVNIFRR
jgi:hypothetical protein